MSGIDEKALLPCPFCGGDARIERYGTSRVSTQYECNECGCSLETGEEWGHGDGWNKRTALPAPADDARGYLIRNVLEPAWPGIHPQPDLLGVCTQVDHVMAGQMSAIAEVYAMLWSIVTDDARIHRARRTLLNAMGGQGSTRQKLALEKYGKAPADLPITAMGDDAVRGELVVALKEARDCVASWGAYASDYFQKKHDLAGDLARIDAALARAGESQ